MFFIKCTSTAIIASALLLLGATSSTALPAKPEPLRLPLKRTTASLRKRSTLESRQVPQWVPGLYDYELTELAIPVNIGTPPKEFLLLFDTGSADTWVALPDCGTSNGCVAATELYDPSRSSTYEATSPRRDFNITYGSASADGVYFVDTVSVANVSLSKQVLGGVHAMTGSLSQQTDFDPITIDGLFGAGFPGLTVMYTEYGISYQPIPFALYEKNLIPSPLFSVHIQRSTETDWAGSVVFGGYDRNLVDTSRDMVFTDVVARVSADDPDKPIYRHWDALVNTVVINRGQATERNMSFTQPQPFHIDTGSNYIIMPTRDADAIVSRLLPGAKRDDLSYLIGCNDYDPKSTITFEFPRQGGTGTIYVSTGVGSLMFPAGGDGNRCRFAIHPTDDSVYLLGNFFLQQFLTIYDFGEKRIGFALLKQ
ncbi:aspartic peptidase domain-containing protein [Fennellomyces sp. T-0311]|nr:aspartic peptidase domain-containing protein [Fennellomyces sp. T-0311]